MVAVLTSEPKEKMNQEDLEMKSKWDYVTDTRSTLKLIRVVT